jgi:hypothetical protein
MLVAPFQNWRRVSVRERRTKLEWAEEIERLVMHDFADAQKVTIVLDNFSIVFFGGPHEGIVLHSIQAGLLS